MLFTSTRENSLNLAKEDSSAIHLIDTGNEYRADGNTKTRIIVATTKTMYIYLTFICADSNNDNNSGNDTAALMITSTKPNV